MTQPKEDTPTGRRTRRARGSLSAEEILRGAFTFVEGDSVDGLSMPRLAQHLGVGVTSIYWYFKSKEDLLDSMTSAALERFYPLLPDLSGLPWDEHLAEFFRGFRRIFREDAVLCDLILLRVNSFTPQNTRGGWAPIESLLRSMVDAGFSPDEAAEAYFALSIYTRGSVMVERMYLAAGWDASRLNVHLALRVDPTNQQRYPILSEQAAQRSFSMVDEADFEFGLANAVEGLRVRLAAPASPASPASPVEPPAEAAAPAKAARTKKRTPARR